MPHTKLSDSDFIKLWKENPSSIKMAALLSTSHQAANERRRRIEKKYNIRLATVDDQSRKAYDQSMLVTDDRIEVKLKCKDGVIIIAGDHHFHPGNVPVMHKAMCYMAKKMKPFAIIWNGDAFDGGSISRFPGIGWEKKPSVKEELDEVRDRSNEILKASPNSKRIWTAGNHDLRFESRIAAVASEYRGVTGIHLKDHFPEWTPAWFVTVNEGLPSHTEIRHRENGGAHAAYNNTLKSGVNIVTGHDHIADVRPFNDRRGRRYGVRHGMTADSARDAPFVNYLEGRKPDWTSGIAILTYKNGILLLPELALMVDYKTFQFRGELIAV